MVAVASLLLRLTGKDEIGKILDNVSDDIEDLGKKAKEAAEPAGKLAGKLNNVGEAGGNAEQGMRGLADVTGFVGEQFGLNLGPIQANAAALADLGGGIEGLLKGFPSLITQIGATLGPLAAKAAAWWAVAAGVIAANLPLILIIATIALVVAALVYFFTQTETGQKVLEAIKDFITDKLLPAFQGIADFVTDNVVPAFTALWSFISDNVIPIFTTLWSFFSDKLLPILKMAVDLYLLPYKLAWEAVSTAITDVVLPATQAIWGFIDGTLLPLLRKAIDLYLTPYKLAWEAATTAVDLARDALGFIFDKIGDVIGKLGALESAIWPARQAVYAIRDAIYSFRDAVADAFWWVVDLIAKIKEIPSIDVTPGFDVPGVPGLAHGGPVIAGRPYIVGEEGPELFVPRASGNIVPSDQLGVASGFTVNFNGAMTVINNGGEPDVTKTMETMGFLLQNATRRRGMWGTV